MTLPQITEADLDTQEAETAVMPDTPQVVARLSIKAHPLHAIVDLVDEEVQTMFANLAIGELGKIPNDIQFTTIESIDMTNRGEGKINYFKLRSLVRKALQQVYTRNGGHY